jgi:hypothetical protein
MNRQIIDTARRDTLANPFATDGRPSGDPNILPEPYINRMKEIGEIYRPIRWLPLDIPRIEFDNFEEFKSIWAEQSHDVVRTKPDIAEPWAKESHPLGQNSSWNFVQFKGLHLYHHPDMPLEDRTFAAKKYTGKILQFDRVVEQVNEYFPMHTISDIFIWSSYREILPHRDKSVYWKCPTEFRVMLADENEEPTLYVADIEHGDVNYIDLPKDTNSFCWSNGTQVHGSDYHGKTKFIMSVAGFQHSTKSIELFDRSIAKYQDKLNYKLEM